MVVTTTSTDFRLMALEMATDAEAEKDARIVDLTIERDIYRDLLQESLGANHRTLAQLEQARREILQLKANLRRERQGR
jgi:hypothetical protein